MNAMVAEVPYRRYVNDLIKYIKGKGHTLVSGARSVKRGEALLLIGTGVEAGYWHRMANASNEAIAQGAKINNITDVPTP